MNVNMPHCRFQNTLDALVECNAWLADNEPTDLEQAELKAFCRLVRMAQLMVDSYPEYCGLNVAAMMKGKRDE